ncbi:MAG: class A beta-lactamase-related serine hydrolase [Bacteroidota bacterium]|nr:class A beta-lactamase-related serine hydrolase [Bacteroidota bacterium]
MKPAFISSLPLLMLLVGCTPDTPPPLSGQVQVLLDRHPDAQVAVAVRDPSTSTSLDIQSDREFHAASTMKIPVMIEAWRQVRAGTLAMDQLLEVRNSFRSIVDGSEYAIVDDSDDAIYERLGEQMSVSELIYQMITVSSNLATNLLIEHLSADSIQHTINNLDASGMQVLRGVEDLKAFELGMSNRTNAQALARLLDLIAHGQAVERAADSTMVEVMLDARFNEMIPAGLPEEVNVAHKTGQITEIHHDAAIVYPPDAPPYVLVILTEGIADDSVSASLGAAITRTIHRALRP